MAALQQGKEVLEMRKTILFCTVALLLLGVLGIPKGHCLNSIETLGKSIFFDTDLSFTGNQSCASCHDPDWGWTGPDSVINAGGSVYEGSIAGRFGNRKPPSSAYATPSPILHYVIEKKEALFIGGNFWDGRATGEKLGNPAADQAQGPFLNPVEQALPSVVAVVTEVCISSYSGDFRAVFGSEVCDSGNENEAFDAIALAIAAFEASLESNAFTSKYDAFLAGLVDLTKEEKKGLNVFKSTGKCANCHIRDLGPNGEPPLFTDFTYDNLGVPKNPDNPFYDQEDFNPLGDDWIDFGLGGFLATRTDYVDFAAENDGKHKVPTLRNVDLRPSPESVKAYGHNGYFKSLKGIVHFYSTRDVKPQCVDPFTTEADALLQGCWPTPEVSANVNNKELGKLNLSEDQEDAIVAFLKTLSDGYLPSVVIGSTTAPIERDYRYESSMGDWVTDIMRAYDHGIDFALYNSGGLREDIDAGDITFGEVWDVLPFGNTLVIVELDGSEVQQVLEEGVTGDHGLVQVSGLQFTFDYDATAGSRIVGDVIDLSTGLPLVPGDTYYVAVNDFMAIGGDGNSTLAANPQTDTGVVIRDIVVNWIMDNTPFTPPDPLVELRITANGTPPL